MRKSDFVKIVAEKAEMTQRDTEKVIDALAPSIKEAVIDGGEEVSMAFGKFKRKVNKARTGINPLTGKELDVKESWTLGFKSSKTMRVHPEPVKTKKSKK